MDWHIISLFFLVLFSILFLYFDIKYHRIPNILSFGGVFIFFLVALFSGFFNSYGLFFLIRSIVLFITFYFLYLQGRIAGGDFKLYFVLTGFLLVFLFTIGDIKINWLFFDMYIVFYSLVIGFVYLLLRYVYLYIKKGFKISIDRVIKIKLMHDRKDAILHFNLFIRSFVYTLFYIVINYFSIINDNIFVLIIVLFEFTFMGVLLSWIKDISFKYLDWFIRKKEIKWFCILYFLLTAIYLFYINHYLLVILLLIFTFIDYIVAILQLNFDTRVIPISELKGNEKLSIRNFPINITKELTLSDEIELDEDVMDYIKENNIKYIEVITEIPYGLFLVVSIYVFLFINFKI